MVSRRASVLPAGALPLLCSRVQAAALLNVGVTSFDKLRKQHALLTPVRLGSRTLWPYRNLVAFIEELIDAADEGADVWDRAAA